MNRVGTLLAAVGSLSWGFAARGQPEVSPAEKELQAQRAIQGRMDKEYRQSVLQSGWAQLSYEAEDLSGMLTELADVTKEFGTNLKALLTSEKGRALAADPATVDVFLFLQDQPRVSTTELLSWTNRAAAIQSRAHTRYQLNEGVRPTPEEFAETKAIRVNAESWLKEAKAQLAVLKQMVDDAPAAPAGTPTLQEVARQRRIVRLQKQLEALKRGTVEGDTESQAILAEAGKQAALSEARLRAEQAIAAQLAEAQFKRMEQQRGLWERDLIERQKQTDSEIAYQNQIAELERKLKLAEAERQKQDAIAEGRTLDTQAETARIKAEQALKDPELLGLLAPFTTPGYSQPGERAASYKKGPVSLSKLRTYGALIPSTEGLAKLIEVGQYHKDKDRPKWGFSGLSNGRYKQLKGVSGEVIDEIRKAQLALIEYGELMVEKGLLSP